ncbi:MAG TPA: hypothetical protein PKD55_05325 [Bellilinea sp.]|nr:hypothetical protein [Bellilinea sp.]
MARRFLLAILALIIVLPACTAMPQYFPDADVTTTPLPTLNPEEGLEVIAPAAQLVYEGKTIQSRVDIGDLLAWSPDSQSLAYVSPANRSWGWGIGDAAFYSMTSGETSFTSGVPIAGDLTWSPDGSKLATVGYLSDKNFHTIYIISRKGESIQDIFPSGSPTDTYDSMKGIVTWVDNAIIKINESCGIDCLRTVDVDTLTTQQSNATDARKATDTSLLILQPTPSTQLIRNWEMPLASPDGSKITYLDARGQAWLIDLPNKLKYSLYNDADQIIEMKWSANSESIAIRTIQRVLIYQFNKASPPQ